MLTTIDKTSVTLDLDAANGVLSLEPKMANAAAASRPKRTRTNQTTRAPLTSSKPPVDIEAAVRDAQPGAPAKSAPAGKAGIVLDLLRRAGGATLAEMMDRTGWQAHSVRGFLSGTVRKKLALTLLSDVGGDGIRHYRIDDGTVRADEAEPIELPAFGPFKGVQATGVAPAGAEN